MSDRDMEQTGVHRVAGFLREKAINEGKWKVFLSGILLGVIGTLIAPVLYDLGDRFVTAEEKKAAAKEGPTPLQCFYVHWGSDITISREPGTKMSKSLVLNGRNVNGQWLATCKNTSSGVFGLYFTPRDALPEDGLFYDRVVEGKGDPENRVPTVWKSPNPTQKASIAKQFADEQDL